MRGLTCVLVCVLISSVMSVRLKVVAEPPTVTGLAEPNRNLAGRADQAKLNAYEKELSKFIQETNKVKLIKWGEYDVYVNQNCPQPPTSPESIVGDLDPIKNCMEASTDAKTIAEEVAKIAAEAATQGVPVKNSAKECMRDLVNASTLKLKPSTTKECYMKSYDDYFQKAFDTIRAKLATEGWHFNSEKEVFEKTGVPTATAPTTNGVLA